MLSTRFSYDTMHNSAPFNQGLLPFCQSGVRISWNVHQINSESLSWVTPALESGLHYSICSHAPRPTERALDPIFGPSLESLINVYLICGRG